MQVRDRRGRALLKSSDTPPATGQPEELVRVQTGAIYPGTFDPVTNGHLDIIRRSRKIFDRVVVAILNNERKKSIFSVSDRIEVLEELLADEDGIEVISFDGLLVDVARERQVQVIIRGLRAISDFEYEFQMAMMNRHLAGSIETLFMVPDQAYTYLSSSLIKEIYGLGSSVEGMVPRRVEERLRGYYKQQTE